ncbi:AAA family ATPase, partial [Nocardia sp. NPDC050193]
MSTTATATSPPGTATPFYRAVVDEVEVFRAAASQGLPILLKGPTGCGKTRFVEAMAHELGRPLITVAGHEDMTSADLGSVSKSLMGWHRVAVPPHQHVRWKLLPALA